MPNDTDRTIKIDAETHAALLEIKAVKLWSIRSAVAVIVRDFASHDRQMISSGKITRDGRVKPRKN